MNGNDLQNNYFDKFNVRRFNYHQRNIHYIGIGTSRDNIINPSSKFFNYSCPRKSRSLINKLKKKCDIMKMLLKINVMLQDDLVDTPKKLTKCLQINHQIPKQMMISIHFGDDFSISNLIKCVKIANKRLLQNNN